MAGQREPFSLPVFRCGMSDLRIELGEWVRFCKNCEMATAPQHLIGENEYLHTPYRPDCDYVDGFVLERNLGTHPHGRLRTLIAAYLLQRERQWQIHAVVGVRLKIRARKYRVPDVMVLGAAASYPAVIEEAPLLCIEIVSPDDKLADLVMRAGDYLAMGVRATWILDPETKRAFVYSSQGTVESPEAVLCCGQIELAGWPTDGSSITKLRLACLKNADTEAF